MTKLIEEQVRAMTPAQREWLIQLELANQPRLKGNKKRRIYEAEKARIRFIRHIQRGGGRRIR